MKLDPHFHILEGVPRKCSGRGAKIRTKWDSSYQEKYLKGKCQSKTVNPYTITLSRCNSIFVSNLVMGNGNGHCGYTGL